jgi:hypothetical protein
MLSRSMVRRVRFAFLTLVLVAFGFQGAFAQDRGRARVPAMDPLARKELADAGVNKYVGQFQPSASEEIGDWTKYTFDTQGGDGPICINGTELSVFHQARDPKKVMVILDGGGACWQDFYFCSLDADSSPPTGGIFADSGAGIDNPLADWSKVFVSYCDGSVFSGDNTVTDPAFPAGGVRHHRGLRNLTAGLDLARALHPAAEQVLLGGISAGGFGVAGFAPAVYRFVFPVHARLFVLNDSGPALTNPALVSQVNARVNDWAYTQFYPASCTECDPFNQPAVFVDWTLAHDRGYRGALYSSDNDATIRFFLSIGAAPAYRNLLLSVQGPINAAYPDRYKRFIRPSSVHTAIASTLFYTVTSNGHLLYQWVSDFVNDAPGWVDTVE